MTETKQATINLRALHAISLASSQEETRYYICGVFVEIEARQVRYSGTNGHILVVHREEKAKAEAPNTLLGGFIIPTHICRAFKFKRKRPSDDYGVLVSTDRPSVLTLNQPSEGSDFRGFGVIDGTFPDVRRVIPDAPPSGEAATYNPIYVATMQRIGAMLRNFDGGIPYIAQNGLNPAIVGWGGLDDSFGIIMPMRANTPKLPEWAKVLPDFTPAEIVREAAE
ncbi:MAG: hypothetical protein PHR16_16675 [Methylovulum sp.]|nr:hypothetical protein [Methylovulum sp.]